jgi:hypothetical protein
MRIGGRTPFQPGLAENITPFNGDPLSGVPLALASIATLVKPKTWRWFANGAVSNYALTPAGWQLIVNAAVNARKQISTGA